MVNQNGIPVKPDEIVPLKVTKHGRTLRATVTIVLDAQADKDLIEAISAIPNGRRQFRLKNAIRKDLPDLVAVAHDQDKVMEMLVWLEQNVRWMVEHIEPIYRYLEEKFAAVGFRPFGPPTAAPEKPTQKKKMSAELKAQIEKNTQEAEW